MHTMFRITDKLGSGEFGEVNKGVWTKIRGSSVEVAVKTLRSNAAEGDRVSFLQEAAIMGQFRHPNIVTLMGVVTIGNPVGYHQLLHKTIIIVMLHDIAGYDCS